MPCAAMISWMNTLSIAAKSTKGFFMTLGTLSVAISSRHKRPRRLRGRLQALAGW